MRFSTGGVALCAIAMILGFSTLASAAVRVESTQVEHFASPMGIDAPQPRLSWVLASDQRDQSQSAYQVLVASSAQKLQADEGDLWDSGKVASSQSVYVPYGGKKLVSFQPCWWKVRVWDGGGTASEWSKPGQWTMGVLDAAQWKGQWIGYNPTFERRLPATGVRSHMNWDNTSWFWTNEGDAANAPAGRRFFRWTLDLPQKPAIRTAYLRAAGGDNGSLRVFLDTLSMPTAMGDYHHPAELELTELHPDKFDIRPGEEEYLRSLHAGRNFIGIVADNAAAGPAGWACKIAVEFEDGTIRDFMPDESNVGWTDNLPPDQNLQWIYPYTSIKFKPARCVGPVGMAPWGKPEYGYLPGWNQTAPEPLLRKTFTVDKPLKRATVYSSGLGCHELYCNGQRVGNEVLDPVFTKYSSRAFYVTHDITNQLQPGKNALGAMLGNGWYNMTTFTAWDFHVAAWRDRPKLNLLLRLEYADGSVQEIVSDTSWKAAAGPVLADSFHNGEYYDARDEQPGWATAEFDDAKWAAAEAMAAPKGALCAQSVAPIRITQTIKPVAITEPRAGVYVFDLGQNIAGHARLRVKGAAGTMVILKYGEKLEADGLLDFHLASLTFSGSWQEDTYVLRGTGGVEEWEPQFAYHGFRYVQVEGLPEKPTLDMLDGRVVHTDFPVAGDFTCSDPMLNAIQKCATWTYRGNFHGFPEDCPTREKKGWLADAHLATEQAMWNFDNAAGYMKWLGDIRDDQNDEGRLRYIAPTGGWGDEDFDWTVAIVVVPWTVYVYTGDVKVLEDNYAAMRKWMEFYIRIRPDFNMAGGMGDWLNPDGPKVAPSDITSVCYFRTATLWMSDIARVLGKPQDADRYAKLSADIQKVFVAKFLQADGTVFNGSQSVTACALYHDMIPADKQAAVLAKLLEKIHAAGDHHATGYFGTKAIYRALADRGQADLAYTMVVQKDAPSYGNWIADGLTTFNEMWRGGKLAGRGMSNNHPWPADISAWFYQYLAGINADPLQPGFKHIIIRPTPVAGLTSASAWHETPYGKVSSGWRIEGGKFILDVMIPVNTTATIFVPGRNVKQDGKDLAPAQAVTVGSGVHHFESE